MNGVLNKQLRTSVEIPRNENATVGVILVDAEYCICRKEKMSIQHDTELMNNYVQKLDAITE
jgi:hypothetical protein